jgi:hypothetical protein
LAGQGIVRLMAPKRPKRPKDFSQAAKLVVDIATGAVEDTALPVPTAAQEFARSGGLKGGKARAAKLSPKRRRDIARIAARTRWKSKREK